MKLKRSGFRNYIFLLTLFIGGCSVMRPEMPPIVSVEGLSRHFVMGQVIHVGTGESLSFDQFIDQLKTKDLIFIGEVHDNPEHHLIQVQILQLLLSQNGSPRVGMEFFQKPQQEFIDSYMAGASTESEFLEDVAWEKNWSFDYSFYRPLILAVKEKKSKILAINAPNHIVRKVAKSGLSSLDPGERDLLAKNIDLKNEKHRAYLMEIFKYNAHSDLKNFEYFYEAQCVWEDTMAENIAESLKKTKENMIVLTGNGHIINKFGVPDRVSDRIPVHMATIVLLPMEDGKQTISREIADYVWLTGKYPERRSFFHKMHHLKK